VKKNSTERTWTYSYGFSEPVAGILNDYLKGTHTHLKGNSGKEILRVRIRALKYESKRAPSRA
jgi:hypothetical protein